MSNKILIVNFNFPPSPSVGGRRWSYFGKVLFDLGCDVKVITSDFNDLSKGICPWGDKIEQFKDQITYLKHKTPYHVLNLSPSSVMGKIKYKISEARAYRMKSMNPYDRSIYFSIEAKNQVRQKLALNPVSNVVLTGGPFHFIVEIVKLKEEFPDSKFIIDLRDPWTENYDLSKLDNPIYSKEREQQILAQDLADTIFVPVNPMMTKLIELWPHLSTKVELLPHGFDSRLFENKSALKKSFNKWYYAGNLYDNLNNEVRVLNDLLLATKSKLELYTYSDSNKYHLDRSLVNYNNVIPQADLLNLTEDAGIALIIFPEEFKNYKSSKFVELVKRGVFILYIGESGEVSEYIEQNEIGMSINPSETDLNKSIKLLAKKYNEFVPKPHLADEYSFDYLGQRIKEKLV